jgi:hypothetical protein
MFDLGLELRVVLDLFIDVRPQPRLAVEKLCHPWTGHPALDGLGQVRLKVVPLFGDALQEFTSLSSNRARKSLSTWSMTSLTARLVSPLLPISQVLLADVIS